MTQLSKRLSLRMSPAVYRYHKRKAVEQGRTFNNYINHLLSADIPKEIINQESKQLSIIS